MDVQYHNSNRCAHRHLVSLIGNGSVLPLHALGIAYSLPDWILGMGLVYLVVNRGLQKQYNLKMLCCRRRLRDLNLGLNSAQSVVQREEKQSADQHEEKQRSNSTVSKTTWRTVHGLFRQHPAHGHGLGSAAVHVHHRLCGSNTARHYIVQTCSICCRILELWAILPRRHQHDAQVVRVALDGRWPPAACRGKLFLRAYTDAIALRRRCDNGRFWGAPIAYDFGSSACVFASQKGCANVYASIFAGEDSLQSLFSGILGPTVAMQLIFILLRAGLATMHDFSFMARSSGACFVVAFVPAIIVARAQNTATAYFVAMYSPHFLMILVFGWRMLRHLRSIRAGQSGPWTIHSETLARGRSMSSGRSVEAKTPNTPLLA